MGPSKLVVQLRHATLALGRADGLTGHARHHCFTVYTFLPGHSDLGTFGLYYGADGQ